MADTGRGRNRTADLLEMARRVIEAKDEIIELQKNRIDWLTARLSEKG